MLRRGFIGTAEKPYRKGRGGKAAKVAKQSF
jgi:hypothetical protein